MKSTVDKPVHDGHRTLLLWALWTLMTLLLLAAGIVGFGAEVPSSLLGPHSEAVRAAVPTNVPDLAKPADTALAADPAARTLDAASGPSSRPVRVRVQVRLSTGGGASMPLPQGVVVAVRVAVPDRRGETELLARTQGPAVWEFAVPAGASVLRFWSHGYRDLDVPLPPAQGGVVELGSVTLCAEAAIRLRLLHVPEPLRGEVVASLGNGGNACIASQPIRFSGDRGEALLPAPSNQPLWLRLQLPAQSGVAVRLPDEVLRQAHSLQAGETREVSVDLQQLPACTLQLVDVPPELLAGFEIAVHEGGRREQRLPVDAAGRVQLLGLGSDAVAFTVPALDDQTQTIDLRTPDELGWLQLEAGALYVLHPSEPLLGVVMRGADGGRLPFRLGLDHPAELTAACQLHVAGARQLQQTGALFVDTGTARGTLAPASMVAAGALRFVEASALTALATLRARPTTPLPDRNGFHVGFEALDGTAVQGTLRSQDGCYQSDVVPPGRYRVVLWRLGGRVLDIASDLAVRAGGVTELPFDLPAVRTWRGEVSNWNELPESLRPRALRLGDAVARTRGDGSFILQSAVRILPGTTVTFAYPDNSSQLSPAVALADVDPLALRLSVAAPTWARSIELRAAPCGSEQVMIYVTPAGGQPVQLTSGQRYLSVGLTACGHVCETLRGAEQVTAWFQLSVAAQDGLIPTGTGARWLTVRVDRPVRHFAVRVRGPSGLLATVAERGQRGELPVLVVDGTQAIEVLCDGEVQRFEPAADIIVR